MQKVKIYEVKQFNELRGYYLYWYTWNSRGNYYVCGINRGVNVPKTDEELRSMIGNPPKSYLTVVRSKEKKK